MADDSGLTDIVRRAAQANAKFYKGWMDLTLEYMRGVSEIFGGAAAAVQSMPATQEMDSGPSTLVLEGEAGTSATGSFLISNDLDRPLSCTLTSSDFADPTGAPAKVRTTFEPAAVELAPGEQQVVRVTVEIGDALVPGVGYASEIAIAGMEGFAVPVVLRRQHTLEDADTGSFDDVGPIDSRPTAPTTPKATNASSAARAAASSVKAEKKPASRKSSTKTPPKKAARRR
ncbi:MAG: hypothetical protein ABI910_12100 [Gemmatimonadota bacterium]